MIRALVLALLAATASAQTLEGPNIQPQSQARSTTFANCHQDSVGVKMWTFQRPPTPPAVPGWVGISHCQVLSDPEDTLFPKAVPSGLWLVSTNTCEAGYRCVNTQARGATNTFTDGGEDMPGPACTPNEPCLAAAAGLDVPDGACDAPVTPMKKRARAVVTGECPSVKGELQWWQCRWKAPK